MAKWTSLGPRQLIKFMDPANQGNYAIPQINPTQAVISPGNVRQYQGTTNGAAVIIGKREYPPTQIQLTWNEMDISDLQAIAAFTTIAPIVYIDNNNIGYLGVLAITSCNQIAGMTSNVWTATMTFMVIGPFNGLTGYYGQTGNPLPQLTIPTLYAVEKNGNYGSTGAPPGGFNIGTTGPALPTAGFIPNNTYMAFWLTMTTRWGESVVGNVCHLNTTAGSDAVGLYWAVPPANDPVNDFYLTSKLYWYTANTSSAATFLSEVQTGFDTGGVDSFITYVPYVQYSLANPPIYGTAFMGYWAGGIFIPESGTGW